VSDETDKIAKKKPKLPDIRDRITDFRRVPGSDLQDNAGNWRIHPQAQRDAFKAVADKVGAAGALLAYHSKRAGGALMLINGHMRKDEYPDFEWPVLITDLDDAEADLLLATYDPLAAMAEANAAKLRELTARAQSDDPALEMLQAQQQAEADLAALMAEVEEELAALESGETHSDDGRGAGLASARARVRPVIWLDDLADFEAALQVTGNPNRGDALAEVCRFYLSKHREKK
jgi:hypothetical protein